MDPRLLRALIVAAPVLGLLITCVVQLRRQRSAGIRLIMLGAGCLLIVALTHVFEALQVASFMGWGHPGTPGHYLDLGSAAVGALAVVAGLVLHFRRSRRLTGA